MTARLALLPTDWLIYGLVVVAVGLFIRLHRMPHLQDPWRRLQRNRLGMVAGTVLAFYVLVGLLDSIHLDVPVAPGAKLTETQSVLDLMMRATASIDEQSYSAPFATHAFTKSLELINGKPQLTYAPLRVAAAQFTAPGARIHDILSRLLFSTVMWLIFQGLFLALWSRWMARRNQCDWRAWWQQCWRGQTRVCWREIILTFAIINWMLFCTVNLYHVYHLMGTDKVGHDVFYASIKSIRTGLIIGSLTTLFVLPFALVLGMVAGYFSGWLDDMIQYLYTTLSSIPGVLLISATILVLQVTFDTHTEWFSTLAQRADARLLMLCVVLGLTGWSGLCRLIRAETLKCRELEFVQAARVLGVGRWQILLRHILPNVFHIVLITVVLDFSGLVLAEAVLTYVGVGVDPTTFSWGNMINSSRLELARIPMVWWPLGGAMLFMFFLVFAANLFADAVRDALDPRLRTGNS